MTDLISRADAIEAVENLQTEQWIDSDIDYNNGLQSAIAEIKALPSADAEWIPCSERLPLITNGDVLATTMWGEITIADRCSTDKWFIHEGNSNAVTSDILAWMPLPKPYKGAVK